MRVGILSVFFRPPEATQMNEALDQVSRAILPSMCCSWPRGDFEQCVCQTAGGEGEEGKSGSRQEKDEKGLDMTGVSLITRFSRRCSWICLLSMEGTKGMDWTSHGNRKSVCVCVYVCLVLCFFCGFIISQFSIPSAFPGSGHLPSAPLAATSMTGTEREKHSVGSKSVTVLTKTCQCGGALSRCTLVHACTVWIADWNSRLL